MGVRTNLVKVIADPNAGKHYLFKEGQFVNEWSGKTAADIELLTGYYGTNTLATASGYSATVQGDNIEIPALPSAYQQVITLPAVSLSDKDHLIVHFTNKNFVNDGTGNTVAVFGHTDLASMIGKSIINYGTNSELCYTSGTVCGFTGYGSYGSAYTFTCATEVYSDDVADKHFIVVSAEESSETDPHIIVLGLAHVGQSANSTFAISEVYTENID